MTIQDKTLVDEHERWLRSQIKSDFLPIYLGDEVEVSERWASEKGRNPNEGKTGIVIDIKSSIQAAFNIDYLIYTIKPERNRAFETYLYTLDRINQTTGNALLERLLRQSISVHL